VVPLRLFKKKKKRGKKEKSV